MSRFAALALAACAASLFAAPLAVAHDGPLDANGCHYDHANLGYHCHKDVPPNPDANAVAKKSRDNVCLDSHSANYLTVRYFISYRSMRDCVASGGRNSGM
jgi:hypothetical protein